MVFVSDTGPWPYSTYLEAIIGSKETVRRVQQSTGLRPGYGQGECWELSRLPNAVLPLGPSAVRTWPSRSPNKKSGKYAMAGVKAHTSAESCLRPPHPSSHGRQRLLEEGETLRTRPQLCPSDWTLLVLPLWDTMPLHACLHLAHTSY